MKLTSTRTITRCGHPPETVHADILHGALEDVPGDFDRGLQWCSVCGAHRWRSGLLADTENEFGEWTAPSGPDGEGVKLQ